MSRKGDTDKSRRMSIPRRTSLGIQMLPGSSMGLPRLSRVSNHGIDDNESELSFKHWHRRMQLEHEILQQSGRKGFRLWKWCDSTCTPCRWFDTIEYDIKLCKCCFTFRTFKYFGTIFLTALYAYIFFYSLVKEQLEPGGTLFFIFLMFLAAYAGGIVFSFIRLPPMISYLVVGIIARHLPHSMKPVNDHRLKLYAEIFEKILLVVALIRAGLLLDLSKIKGRVRFILGTSLFPLLSEFLVVLIVSHYSNNLSWDWAAIQGSILSVVSLAGITSIMEKNKHLGYGEDKDLATVLIAAAALDITIGFFLYVACTSVTFADRMNFDIWDTLSPLLQCLFGLLAGIVSGILVAYFPDKRSAEAPVIRILIIGVAAFALASIFNTYSMEVAGVLAALTMCLIASNMWEEMGWHENSNPVTYFYSLVYTFSQPVALTLVGYTINFSESNSYDLGMSAVTVFCGTFARELVCFLMTLSSSYPTSKKEKLFICIAWLSKGTFQALLAHALDYMKNESNEPMEIQIASKRIIVVTTILGILFTTPVGYFTLTILSPTLLHKREAGSSIAPIFKPPSQRFPHATVSDSEPG